MRKATIKGMFSAVTAAIWKVTGKTAQLSFLCAVLNLWRLRLWSQNGANAASSRTPTSQRSNAKTKSSRCLFAQKVFSRNTLKALGCGVMSLKLKVDGKDIPLNEFVERFIMGTVIGGVSSLKGIKDNWEKIEIEIKK